jgi:transcription factor TGA
MSQLEPLTDQQLADVCNLRQSSQQAEDALTQGIDKLQQTLSESIAADVMGDGGYGDRMADELEGFVNQVIIS